MQSRHGILIVFFVVIAGIAFARGNSEPESQTDPQPTTEAVDDPAGIEEESLVIEPETAELLFSLGISPFENRIPAENFFLPVLDGVEQSLKDYEGRFVFLNFWATWCPPCREEMPSMQELYDELADEGLEILAVNVLEPEDLVRDFIDEYGFTYPVMLDRQGKVSTQYRVRAFPTTYLLDRNSNVIAVRTGYHDWSSQAMVDGFRALLEQ